MLLAAIAPNNVIWRLLGRVAVGNSTSNRVDSESAFAACFKLITPDIHSRLRVSNSRISGDSDSNHSSSVFHGVSPSLVIGKRQREQRVA